MPYAPQNPSAWDTAGNGLMWLSQRILEQQMRQQQETAAAKDRKREDARYEQERGYRASRDAAADTRYAGEQARTDLMSGIQRETPEQFGQNLAGSLGSAAGGAAPGTGALAFSSAVLGQQLAGNVAQPSRTITPGGERLSYAPHADPAVMRDERNFGQERQLATENQAFTARENAADRAQRERLARLSAGGGGGGGFTATQQLQLLLSDAEGRASNLAAQALDIAARGDRPGFQPLGAIRSELRKFYGGKLGEGQLQGLAMAALTAEQERRAGSGSGLPRAADPPTGTAILSQLGQYDERYGAAGADSLRSAAGRVGVPLPPPIANRPSTPPARSAGGGRPDAATRARQLAAAGKSREEARAIMQREGYR